MTHEDLLKEQTTLVLKTTHEVEMMIVDKFIEQDHKINNFVQSTEEFINGEFKTKITNMKSTSLMLIFLELILQLIFKTDMKFLSLLNKVF